MLSCDCGKSPGGSYLWSSLTRPGVKSLQSLCPVGTKSLLHWEDVLSKDPVTALEMFAFPLTKGQLFRVLPASDELGSYNNQLETYHINKFVWGNIFQSLSVSRRSVLKGNTLYLSWEESLHMEPWGEEGLNWLGGGKGGKWLPGSFTLLLWGNNEC